MGTRPRSAPNSQISSWDRFGFSPGRIMDPLNSIGLQGALQSTINPPFNIGIPCEHCRDFEEQGFCLRGNLCPMEHGLNRIIMEDVQSLSQFDLPVSVPSSHGSGPLPLFLLPSSQLANSKFMSSRSRKSVVVDDAFKVNNIPFTSDGADPDVYDPDQPLWKNGPPDASAALSRLSSPNINYESSWLGDLRSDGKHQAEE